VIQGRGPPGIVAEKGVELGVERRVLPSFAVAGFQFLQSREEHLGNVHAAVFPEVPALVRQCLLGILQMQILGLNALFKSPPPIEPDIGPIIKLFPLNVEKGWDNEIWFWCIDVPLGENLSEEKVLPPLPFPKTFVLLSAARRPVFMHPGMPKSL
jgi:hypothetical protein